MKKLLITLSLVTLITACGGGDNGSANTVDPITPEVPTNPNDGKTEEELLQDRLVIEYNLPAEPDPDVNNSTINGVDANNNLIRDDWERGIVFAFYEDTLNMNLHNALAKNTTLLNNYYEDMNVDEYAKASKEDQYIVECGGLFYGIQKFNNRELFNKDVDTRERLIYTLKRESAMAKIIERNLHGIPESKLRAICPKYK